MELSQVIAKLNDNYKPNRELSFDDLRIAWERCEDAPKMLGLAVRLDIDKTIFVQIACKCARFVLHLVPEGEDRPRLAIEAAEAWIETPSKENGNAAAHAAAAFSATYNAAAYAASYAGYAAAYAAYASYSAAIDTAYAAYTADAAYYVGRIDISARQKCADVVREYIPSELLLTTIIFRRSQQC